MALTVSSDRAAAVDDPIAAVLHGLHVTASCYVRSELTAPWGIRIPACPVAGGTSLHFMARGHAWVTAAGRQVRLDEGGLALFLHGDGSLLGDAPDTPEAAVLTVPEHLDRPLELRHGGGGPGALVLSAGARLDPPNQPIVALLPSLVHIGGGGEAAGAWVAATLNALRAEAEHPRRGGETIITRLCDVLLLQAVRAWLQASTEGDRGRLGALGDEHVGRAVALMHRDPARPWTVASLAAAAHLSRAAFAQRFAALTGTTPMAYLAEHRMQLATRMLRDDGLAPAAVAPRVGYGSVAAFGRAYKRIVGVSPGAAGRPLSAAVRGRSVNDPGSWVMDSPRRSP